MKPKQPKVTTQPPTRFVIASKAAEYLNVSAAHVYTHDYAAPMQVYVFKDKKFHKVTGAKIKAVDFKSIIQCK